MHYWGFLGMCLIHCGPTWHNPGLCFIVKWGFRTHGSDSVTKGLLLLLPCSWPSRSDVQSQLWQLLEDKVSTQDFVSSAPVTFLDLGEGSGCTGCSWCVSLRHRSCWGQLHGWAVCHQLWAGSWHFCSCRDTDPTSGMSTSLCCSLFKELC